MRTALKRLLAEGAVGEITAVVAGKGSRTSRTHGGWLADPASGGGWLLFLGSHLIDQVLWLLGGEVRQVQAEMTLAPTGVDETTFFTMRFDSGIRADLIVSKQVGVSFDYVEVLGTAGRARAETTSMLLEVQSSALTAYKSPASVRMLDDPRRPMYMAELLEFAAAIREDREPAITGKDGLRVLEVIDAVFASAKTGRPVQLGTAAAV